MDPAAPYGRHPLTGEPLSDKSKIVAGTAAADRTVRPRRHRPHLPRLHRAWESRNCVVGLVTCGIGAVVWGIIDAVLIFTDKVRDPEGRPLREGT